jgi:catechol 2,3-dioxygenase-like lactoylglutathione lyase family enzyme
MKIPRLSMVTLGVADLGRATAFYENVLATPPHHAMTVSPLSNCREPGLHSIHWRFLPRIARLTSRSTPAVSAASRSPTQRATRMKSGRLWTGRKRPGGVS